MRTMYDSVTPTDIPTSAQMVAGYISGTYRWPQSGWDRFPNAVHVKIATRADVNDGHVLDVEPGDATPAQAPGWVRMRRAAGVDPTVYTSLSEWASVRQAFAAAGVPEPHYWIAHYNGDRTIPAGAVAIQYADPPSSGGHYDLSAVADYWPGVDQGGAADMAWGSDTTQKQIDDIQERLASIHFGHFKPIREGGLGGDLGWLDEKLAPVLSKLDAIAGTVAGLTDDEKNIITAIVTAIRAQPTGGQVDVPTLVSSLAGPLAAALAPLTPPEMTPAQFIHLLAAQLPN